MMHFVSSYTHRSMRISANASLCVQHKMMEGMYFPFGIRHFGGKKKHKIHGEEEHDWFHEIKSPALPAHEQSVILSLGSNMGDRVKYVEEAIENLKNLGTVRRVSSMYETDPMYVTDQGPFLNACIELGTALGPVDLLDAVKGIEQRMGRTFVQEKGPRNIDIDIVLYGNQTVRTDELTIPHPLRLDRPFVMAPLQEVVDRDRKDPISKVPVRNIPVIKPPRYVEGLGSLQRCLVMGVLNVTPDSFSDGGKYVEIGKAVEHALSMVEAGAAIIDVGGESTRPGAETVPIEDEIRRVSDVIKQLTMEGVKVSIDTRKKAVAEEALKAGAIMVNDISFGTYDEEMLPFIREKNTTYVGMHMLGSTKTMDKLAQYEDVVQEVRDWLAERAEISQLPPWRLIVDPGLGFSKTPEMSLKLVREIDVLRTIPAATMMGFSRKRFVGYAAGIATGGWEKEKTFYGNLALVAECARADILRVHDVAETKIVLDVLEAVRSA